MNNIGLMKQIDSLIGKCAAEVLSPPAPATILTSVSSLLLIRPGGIGDAVLLAPAIHSIRSVHPGCRITILAEQRNAGVFQLISAVDEVFCYDCPKEFWTALRGSYDVVIDTEQWHRLSAIVARFVHAPIKIGFATNQRRRMFTHTVDYSHDDYEVDSFTRLLEPLLVVQDHFDSTRPFLTVPAVVQKTADKLLARLDAKPVVVIFPGASIAERRWGADRFRQVALQLAELGYLPIVVGGITDQADGQLIAGGCGVSLAGKTSLAETAAVISKSLLVISGDSGVLHIAVGLGVPTVSLFGPGRALKWAPHGDRHHLLNRELACSPCTTFGTTPPCPYDARCMQEISVPMVMDSVLQVLNQEGTPQ